jgi:7,8-dihydroneopterin aldolase/epimerase/oxygenase
MNPLITTLRLEEIELYVHLGWPENERAEKQLVQVTIELWFNAPPLACHSDLLQDTVCYSTLIHLLQEKINTQSFHLLEHLSATIYAYIKHYLATLLLSAKVKIAVTKHPKIVGLNGPVIFYYGDQT